MTTQRQLVEAYRNVFLHSPEGQTILKDMMKASGLFQVTGIRSNEELQHLEGARDIVRRIIGFLGLSDEQIFKIAIGEVIDE